MKNVKVDDILEFIEFHWKSDNQYTDLDHMLERGLVDMLCDYIVGAGGVEEHNSNSAIELAILERSGKYTAKKRKADDKEFWYKTTCLENSETNECLFLDSHYNSDEIQELMETGKYTIVLVDGKRLKK